MLNRKSSKLVWRPRLQDAKPHWRPLTSAPAQGLWPREPVPAHARNGNALAAAPDPPDGTASTAADWPHWLSVARRQLGRATVEPARGQALKALDHLALALGTWCDRCRQAEARLVQAEVALVHARADLAGTRDAERRARLLASQDPLTGLPNRACFRDQLEAALKRAVPGAMPLSVLFLDLDNLKQVNDRHGHGVGDEVLRIVASRLRRALRDRDVVSRLGGDEFACLVRGALDERQISRLACKLFDAVSAPMTIGALNLNSRVSIGIAPCTADGVTPDELMHRADTAMYRAKREQTGYAFFAERDLVPGANAASPSTRPADDGTTQDTADPER